VIKILDFGLARLERDAGQAERLTQLNTLVGTVDYISPEQAENARAADIRSDIFSLGCSLYHLLAAQPPFGGGDIVGRTMAQVLGEAPSVRTWRPEVPAALDGVLVRMLARNPAERFQTPAAVATALEPFTTAKLLSPSLAMLLEEQGTQGDIWRLATARSREVAGARSKRETVPLTKRSITSHETTAEAADAKDNTDSTWKLLLLAGTFSILAVGGVLAAVVWLAWPPGQPQSTDVRAAQSRDLSQNSSQGHLPNPSPNRSQPPRPTPGRSR
jgi:serine/threonine protein kinase